MTTERFARASRDNCLRDQCATSGPYRRTPPFWPVAVIVVTVVVAVLALAVKFAAMVQT